MALTGNGNQEVPNAPALKRLGHDLGLARRHHRVLQPMHQQHRPDDPAHGMQRGAGPIGGHRLRIGANQPLQLVGLELGGLPAEALQIGDAEPADPPAKNSSEARAHRAVKPPALSPLITSRRPSTSHDEVWMTAGGAAAAVWLPPPGRWQLSRPQRLRLLPALVRFLGLRTASVLGGLERMEVPHPHDPPHWYLFILGTEPAAQGQGWGSALLAQVLARVDADGMPTYLESSSERNLALYGRHGFEVASEVAIPGGPRIWPMWRQPHP